MIPTATVLATLARLAAEDVFDLLTADCSEPMRLERMSTMPKYTTELVPTMPLPHAPAPAPAPAADAATGERTQGPDWRVAALLAENDNLSAGIDGWMRKAVAAEADRDRLVLEVAALRGAIAELAAAADDSEWHYSEDCEVEGRTDCRLCAAIRAAGKAGAGAKGGAG